MALVLPSLLLPLLLLFVSVLTMLMMLSTRAWILGTRVITVYTDTLCTTSWHRWSTGHWSSHQMIVTGNIY